MKVPNTLLQLLEDYYIEIPRVQRDYVQGSNEERPSLVRNNLLKDIQMAIEGRIEPLDLSFIYGKTTPDGKFYPVDGQQRLTTLFLLHIFAFSDDDSKTNILLKFSYQARTTTRDFFEALVKNRKDIFSEKELPEITIKDAAWFIDSWKYDPSVSNAITMLNDISKKEFCIEQLKRQLEEKETPRLYFQFIKLDDLGMEDDLYIKLNARGRALTEFESFKSRFIDRCTEACPSLADEVKKNIDGIWADSIWSIGKEKFDELFLRFFETVFLNYNLLKTEANQSVSNNWMYSMEYGTIPAQVFETVRNVMNYLASDTKSEAFHLVIDAIKNPASYPQKTLFHAVCGYLSDEKDPTLVNAEAFADWLRLFKNLANNSRIEEADVYSRAIESINHLLANKTTILAFLAAGKPSILLGYQTEQIDEECLKARIMCRDMKQKQAIVDAEKKLTYFGGQIRSILYYSDFEKTGNISDLDSYVEKEKALFNDREPKYGRLLRRALCAIGDYRLSVGNYKTLCIDDPNENSRSWSMKRLFSSHGKEVKELLDNINISNPIETQLEQLINKKTVPQTSWRYCMVNYADILFPKMSASHLRTCNNGAEELMVPNKQSNGENYSIHLLTLEHLLKKNGIKSIYYTEKGLNGDRYLKVKDSKVRYKKEQFVIEDSVGNISTTKTNDVFDEVIAIIKKMP